MKPWHWLFLALALLAAWLFGRKAVDTVLDLTKRGRRLSVSNLEGGVILESPEALRAQAQDILGRPVDLETYALARMIRSEAGSAPGAEKLAVAHVAQNDAAELGRELFWVLTYNKQRGGSGMFGEQRGGRYATSRDPYENDYAAAEAVQNRSHPDHTGGAVKFVHLSAFGVQPGTMSADEVIEKWAREGLVPRQVDGTSASFRVFVRQA